MNNQFELTQAPSLTALSKQVEELSPDPDENETFWEMHRAAYGLKPGLIHLNSANFAPASNAVLETTRSVSIDVNGDPSFENRVKHELASQETRGALARMLCVDEDEIAITRNTSESNNTVMSGFDFAPGDEVLVWDQNHDSNNMAWDVFAKRKGFTITRISTPPQADSPAALIEPFLAAMNSQTKLISFSHVSNMSGVALPARDLCASASKQGIATLLDGAQSFGMMPLDLHAIGCDFFTASSHKWLAGPHETGVLYVRSDRVADLWPPIVGIGWDDIAPTSARKFECVGQRQYERLAALATAIAMQDIIGRGRIEQRIRFLANYLREGLRKIEKDIDFVSPRDERMNAGIVAFTIPVKDARAVMATMYDEYSISALAIPSAGRTLVRFSPNIYNSRKDLDIAAAAIAAIV